MDTTIKQLMTQTTAWHKLVSRNGAGERTYDQPVNISCYITGGSWLIKDFTGEEVVSNTKLFVDGGDFSRLPIEGDLFTDDLGKARPLKKVNRFYHPEMGVSILEVFL